MDIVQCYVARRDWDETQQQQREQNGAKEGSGVTARNDGLTIPDANTLAFPLGRTSLMLLPS